VNKWDLVDLGPTAGDEYRRLLAERLKHLSWAPVLLASALNGRNIAKLLDLARDAYRSYSRQIPTPELNSFFRRAVGEYKPPTLKGRKISMGYITQESRRPPAFAVLVNDAARVHFTYRRYLENRMREQFDFGGTSIILRFRGKARPGAAKREALKADTRKPLDRKFSGDKPAKRFGVKKTSTKKSGAGKSDSRKSAARQAADRKAAERKPGAKKPGARKPIARKTPAAGRKRRPSRDIR
jgi:hypothetical protein